ncbi:LysR family transcriptional regulator, partial [Pseudomonas poae]
MNWDDLKVFIFVAKSNNVTEAGNSLKVSASTVSRKIAALEESLST